ncbi:platelet glycoprotein 4-like isoform X2 [Patiria miniata]|uniref:Scavenger receptor class B member 1 n=1 Tax=Patiria miniata TaxID=46514 RepID=A0A913ZZ45_PATMI|nr:platelet glycoprotein 4-like isoform X2 [Patiria miniata]
MGNAGKVCLSVVLGLGIICAVIGGVMFPILQTIIHNEIVAQTMLENGTMGYEIWKDPTADVYMQFWVWNLTNPDEVQAGTKEPYLVQQGPYTYREVMIKENITSHSNGTITYAQQKSYILDLDLSVGDPSNHTFTTVNIPAVTAAGLLPFLSALDRLALKIVLDGTPTFQSKTVEEILWGYEDLLTQLAYSKNLYPYPEFGIFVNRNNSNDGLYTVYSGVDKSDTDKINHISRWKGESELSFWSSDEANMLNGTDGSYNAPFFDKKKMMYVFSSDICRSINAVFDEETSVRDIPTWRYVGPPSAFANATENPSNAGFCTPSPEFCLPSGLLNISNCQHNAPIVMSLPHFLYCDKEKVIDLVHGVVPNQEEHQTFFDIEPMTGGPLNVAKRLQINIHMQPYPDLKYLKNLSKFYLPVIWLNESALVTQSGADQLIEQVENPILYTTIAKWGVLGLGILMVAISTLVLTIMWIMKPSKKPTDSAAHPGLQAPYQPNVAHQNPQVVPINPNGPVAQHSERTPLIS